MKSGEIYVTKADGTQELFDKAKLENSLKRAGASSDAASHITDLIKKEIEGRVSTLEIRDRAFQLLHRMEKPISAKYSLKRALAELGPSGFPFERFVAEIFRSRGYHVETNQFIHGHCAEHEIDLVVWNDDKLAMIEAKFHNELGLKSDLKVALYVKARIDDLKGVDFFYGRKRKLDEGWLITNTKFTEKAISYASCAGLNMIGWNYPLKGNLHNLIEDVGLHPITSLNILSLSEKRSLIEAGVVLCRDVRNPAMLSSLGFDNQKIDAILEEVDVICPPKFNVGGHSTRSFINKTFF